MTRLVSLALMAVLIPCFVTPAAAQDEARMKLATRLMELVETGKMLEEYFATFKKAQLEMFGAVGKEAGLPPGEIAKLESFQNEVEALIRSEISVDMIVKEAIPIYASLFSDEELRGMIAFFESPVGRAWVQKTPEISTRMAEIVQTRMSAVVPKILELIKKRRPPQQ